MEGVVTPEIATEIYAVGTPTSSDLAQTISRGIISGFRTKEDGIFLSYYLNSNKKIDIAKLGQGVSVVHLYASQLKLLKISLPSLPEQTKIANFLSSIDTKIDQATKQLNQTKQFKKALLQQMFV
jgi:type I restriction enzyme S subunit